MPNGEFRVIFVAEDYESTLAFYGDGLGLPVAGSWDRGDDRGTLFRAASGIVEVLALPPGEAFVPPRGIWIGVEVEDVDGRYRQARDRELPVTQKLQTQPWGHRAFKVSDPNGIEIALFSVVSSSGN